MQFFLSTEQKCSYLDNLPSASIFSDPDGDMTAPLYSELINQGFQRSANFIYRPHCPSCNACKPTRVPVQFFESTRSQKRVVKRNLDLTVSTVSSAVAVYG